MTSRKYSRKGIPSKPKTFKAFKSAVNKVLWRKFRTTRVTLGLEIAEFKVAYAAGVSADEYVKTIAE